MAQFRSAHLAGFLVALTLFGCAKAESAPAAEYPERAPAAAEDAPGPPAQAQSASSDIPAETTPTEPAAQARLSDAQIAKITDTVNGGEVEQAKLAKQRAKSPAVKKFANQMVTQHTTAKEQGLKLSRRTDIEPQASAVSTELARKGTETLESLKAADANSFDRAYMDSQVEQHQAVLDQLDNDLIPAAINPQLKAELEKARAMVDMHLKNAKQIQDDL